MSLVTTTLKLPPETLHVLDSIARQEDVTTGHLIRAILSKEISRRKNAKPSTRVDEQLVAPLRARLAPDFANAPNWAQLQARLRAKGYDLRPAGGGLALHSHPDGVRVCKASELGFSYSKLLHRLRAPFPGHTHTHVYERIMRDHPEQVELDCEVIDPPQRTILPSGHLI